MLHRLWASAQHEPDGTMKIAPEQTGTASSFLDEMIHRLGSHASFSASLDVEMNEVPFHVSAKGDSAIISFDRLPDALKVLWNFIPDSKHRTNSFEIFSNVLKKLGLTIYIQNHHFGVLGPKANPLYRKLLVIIGLLR